MLINAIIQTASFRYGEQWRCAHELLAERGVDARRCIMTGLDHGEDVHIDLWLPDRTYVSVDFEESQAGKDLVAIQSWDAWSATPETDGKTPSLLESLEDQWVIRALLRSEMISVFDRHVHEEHLTHRFETLLLTHRI